MSNTLFQLQDAAATVSAQLTTQFRETQACWEIPPTSDGIYIRPKSVITVAIKELELAALAHGIDPHPLLREIWLIYGAMLERQTPQIRKIVEIDLPIVMYWLERMDQQSRYTPPPFLKKDEWYTAPEVTAAMTHALGLKGHTLNARMVDLLEQAGILKTKNGRYMLTDYQEPEWMQRIRKGHGESGDYLDD